MKIDQDVWNVVRNVAGSRDGSDIDAIDNKTRIATENRLANNAVLPGDQIAFVVQSCHKFVQIHWPVLIAPHIIFSSPEQFHRESAMDRFCNLNGLRSAASASAEAAPSIECMNVDLLRGQARDPGRVILYARNIPITGPDVALIC